MTYVYLFRLHSVQVITEHERLVEVVVTSPWVDDFLGVVSWPRKGKKDCWPIHSLMGCP